jgi:glutathione synthase/RimK-type ligase-like ATP-grasp enzyme
LASSVRTAPSVLTLTQDFDPTADAVIGVLQERGARVARLDLSYFPRRLVVTASDFGAGRRVVVRHGDRELDLSGVSGLWYRRPTAFDFGSGLSPAEEQRARDEATHGVGGILRALGCLWVNRPDREAVAGLKPYQLHVAKRLGMRVPRTLFTNDPAEVAALLAACGGPIVYKPLSGGILHYPGGFPTGLLTTVVGDELGEHLDRVRHTMGIFQEYIEKAYEVRLTVIGNTYFPVAIRSQEDPATRVDWRAVGRTVYGDFQPVPAKVVQQVQSLLETLDLPYAAVDFIVTPDGEYVFLEVNPDGQFMWLKHDLNLPFCERLADLLITGGPVRRGADVTQIGY